MTILEKMNKREDERMAKSESGWVNYEDPMTRLRIASPHAYNRVVDAVRRVFGERDSFIEGFVAIRVIYKKVNVSSNSALDDAVRAVIADYPM